MKISIITVSYNASETIAETLQSVAAQIYADIEHIIVDGASTDGTQDHIRDNLQPFTRWVSEKDDGLYDAMNKGLKMATGDVVGFLNADDVLNDAYAISRIARAFDTPGTEVAFSDLSVVAHDNLQRVLRHFGAKNFRPWHMRMGYMPPHPTVYARRSLVLDADGFDTSLSIGADFELLLRLLVKRRANYAYVPGTLVKLRAGGLSTSGFKSTLQINRDFLAACRKNDLWSHPVLLYGRYLTKFTQLFYRPKLKL